MLTLMYSPDECTLLAEAIRLQQSKVQAMAATIGTLRSGLDSRIAARNSIGTRLNTLQSNIKKQSDLLTKFDLALKTYINDKAANESKHTKGGNTIEYLMKEAMRSFELFKGGAADGAKIYLPTLFMFAAADKFRSLLELFGKTSGAGTLVGVVGLPKLFGIAQTAITPMPSLPHPYKDDFVGRFKDTMSAKSDGFAGIFAGAAGILSIKVNNVLNSTTGGATKKSSGLLGSIGKSVGSMVGGIGKGVGSLGIGKGIMSSGFDTVKSGTKWLAKQAVVMSISAKNTTIGSFNKLKSIYNSDVGEYFRELGGNCLTTLGSGCNFFDKLTKGDLPGAWAEGKIFGDGITSVLYTSASGVVYGIGKVVELTGNKDAAKWFYDYADENRGIDGVGSALRHEAGGDPAMTKMAEISDGLTYAAKVYKTISGLPKLAEKGAKATEMLFKGEFGDAFMTVTGWKNPSFSDDYAFKLPGGQYIEKVTYINDYSSNIKKAEKYTTSFMEDGLLGLAKTTFDGAILVKDLKELDGYLKDHQQFSDAFLEYKRDQRSIPR